MKALRAAFLFLPLFALASPAAEIRLYGPAKTSLAELAVPSGIRAIGMGGAYSAAGDDAESLHYNPANLARMGDFELGLAHNEWSSSLGLRQETGVYGQQLGKNAGLALSMNYFFLGTMAGRSADGALLADSSPYAFGASGGYGRSFLGDGRLKAGLALEFATENIYEKSMSGFGGSGGLTWLFGGIYSAGLSAMHLGTGAGGFSPPTALNLGLAAAFLNRRLLLALDATEPLNGPPALKSGAEYDFGGLKLRGGYRQALGAPEGDAQSGISAGLGFRFGHLEVNYAYLPYGEVLSSHQVALTLLLPGEFFEPKVAGPEMSTGTAQSYYDQAIVLDNAGKQVEALVMYQMVENAYPEDMEEHPQEFYLLAQRRMKSIQSDMEKNRGDSAETEAFIRQHVKKARDFLEAGRAQEALAEVRQVEAFDKNSDMIVKLRKDVELSMSTRLFGLRGEAHAAIQDSNLPLAVDRYIKIQSVDSNDKEAAAFFSNRHADIRAMLVGFHRRGIDFYVSGKVPEAIEVWKKGAALDIDKGQTVDFERDIRKAKMKMELGGLKKP